MGLSFSRQYSSPGDNVQSVVLNGKLCKKMKSKKASPGRQHYNESSVRRNERKLAKAQANIPSEIRQSKSSQLFWERNCDYSSRIQSSRSGGVLEQTKIMFAQLPWTWVQRLHNKSSGSALEAVNELISNRKNRTKNKGADGVSSNQEDGTNDQLTELMTGTSDLRNSDLAAIAFGRPTSSKVLATNRGEPELAVILVYETQAPQWLIEGVGEESVARAILVIQFLHGSGERAIVFNMTNSDLK
ncbi:hypothetical protein SISSUDRAFT_1037453 [Sistotremastrum suecicum HHB10207 ss-3]|uniref:Uncharacterized protein n=1 Tax=Sistotremastrum suecicum HHB10207 ss-3 TaxID=1314776 RepID=A0A165Y3U6_9AGAM|nr:hypothetical protein SISSUDRAFT_1037453 [Sistotremastrum suecicum HHB10207 ss-3]